MIGAFDLWHAAMIIALPFVMGSRKQRVLRLRVWTILFLMSAGTWLWQSIAFYIFIDLVGAAAVMKQPKTDWQRAVGASILIAATITLGFAIAEFLALQNILSAVSPRSSLMPIYVALAWVQLGFLLAWSDNCGGRFIVKIGGLFHRSRIDLASFRPWGA